MVDFMFANLYGIVALFMQIALCKFRVLYNVYNASITKKWTFLMANKL